ncbi:RHS repeat domain-containing protein [Gilliamella sp. ESL0250]|uniref:RHS repeat domain-containing protein n=1 Tax=Gilliamella sp. ESL0250 TaxID=2705036 RepID=UPI001933F544|nr:RHS repeat-associated core domain-containing protein [Gilliamella sp. ESL0250]
MVYDPLGNRITTTLPDGRTINSLYYGSGHLHQINIDSHIISDIERDNLDRLVSKKHSKYGQTDYRYDRTGRIEGCRNQRYWETLQYDAAANLLDSKYREDYSNHNLIRCNQLLHFRGHHYLYDALGRRIEKQKLDREGKPYNRTRFLWVGLRMIQETGPNHPTSLYIYTDQNSYDPLARIDKRGNEPERVMYFHTDLNGCPEELTDANGEILWECSFQLWRKRIHEIEHESVEQNLRYQGQYLDRETGLHYNTFRHYDPYIGRFTQPDLIGLLGGFNLYQYAPNGLTWVDLLGLSCSFNSKSNRSRNNETGRFTKRPTDPSELVKNGRVNKADIDAWAIQGGIPNTSYADPNRFPKGGFKYEGEGYQIHGHGMDPAAQAKCANIKFIK